MKETITLKLVRYLAHLRENNHEKLIHIYNRYCDATGAEHPIGWTVGMGGYLERHFIGYEDLRDFLIRVADGKFNPRDWYFKKDEDGNLISLGIEDVKGIIPIFAIAAYWMEDIEDFQDEEAVLDYLEKTLSIESDWDWDAIDEDDEQEPEDNNQNDLPHVERILIETAQGDTFIFELHLDLDAGGYIIKANGGAKFAIRLSDRLHLWGGGDDIEKKYFIEDVDLHELLEEEADANQ